jgi:hypothetical protein
MPKLFLVFLFPVQVFALSFEVIGPCSEKPIYQTETNLQNLSLGVITEQLLKQGGVPYTGSPSGIQSIANSPVGKDAIEVLSDASILAYGWCVEVDGFQADRMPDQVIVDELAKKIRWFYAFSLYQAGEWKQYCTPSYLIRSSQICK